MSINGAARNEALDTIIDTGGGVPDPLEVNDLKVSSGGIFGALTGFIAGVWQFVGELRFIAANAAAPVIRTRYAGSPSTERFGIDADGHITWPNGAEIEPHLSTGRMTIPNSQIWNWVGTSAAVQVGGSSLTTNALEIGVAGKRIQHGTSGGQHFRFYNATGGQPNWLMVEAVPRRYAANISGTYSIVWGDRGTCQELTLTGNTTINPPGGAVDPSPMGQYQLLIRQDATGGRTCAFDAKVSFGSGSFVMPSAPNARTIVSLVYDSTTETYMATQGYSD